MWIWARFHANEDDPRPLHWPLPGPYWVTGYGDDYAVIVAYVKTEEQIKHFWPDATDIETEQRDSINYTDRFAKPDWYTE